ncbi:MAG: aa3-type cytochrome c oxidase subunit IV [Pseudomonadota bacterium]
MDEHKHGEMDITEQERAFEGFVSAGIYLCIFVIVLLVFIALVNG